MSTTIIAVCGRTNSRFFSSSEPFKSLKLEAELNHPQGRLQDHNIHSDKKGETASSSHRGHNTASAEEDPIQHDAILFASEVATWLNTARNDHRCERFVIIADPKFTGHLREKMDKHVFKMVNHFIGKDLQKASEAEIISHVSDLLP